MREINTIAVVGLGYVGCPLAFELSKHFRVVGFDIDERRVKELRGHVDKTGELSAHELTQALWTLTSNATTALAEADVIIVTVPTPITTAHVPDLEPVIKATKTIASHMRAGATIIYESTVYPGVTEEICVPLLEGNGHKRKSARRRYKEDFWVAYSPERINPGDTVNKLTTMTKIVSGDTPETLELVARLYATITNIYKASTIKVAEAAKVIENTQRDVNIALMNELSQIFYRLNIDTLDAIDAAASKWNFHRYVPGFVGGHCISVDPYYLTHRSTQFGYIPSLILSAREVNDKAPAMVAEKTLKALRKHISSREICVTVLGITFKENVPDIRNSKAVELVRELLSWGVEVQVIDPIADPRAVANDYGIKLTPYNERKKSDAVILAVAHDAYVRDGWASVVDYCQQDQPVVVTDVKGVLNRSLRPSHITLVRI